MEGDEEDRLKRIAGGNPYHAHKTRRLFYTHIFPTSPRYFPYRSLPIYLTFAWRLLVCVCYVIHSTTVGFVNVLFKNIDFRVYCFAFKSQN